MSAPRILVVDDEQSLRRLIDRYLTMQGYDVVCASDGNEALAEVERRVPDLIITDVMMPNLDGWDLVQKLRTKADLLFVPIIYVTALGAGKDRIRGFRFGADDYVTKPFELEELELRVARALSRRDSVERDLKATYRIVDVPDDRAVSGTLAQIGLASVLTLLEMERKSGLLLMHRDEPAETVRIFIKQGRVVAARGAEERNEPAVFRAMGWRNGRFEFAPLEFDIDEEVRMSTTGLIMESARMIDERER
ncbi:MAG: response regulator [Myxococcales bacterium]|nr:response regulator [Myxococcales bacterium]